MTRSDVVEILDEIAVLLELKGESGFRVRAYGSAARAIEQFEGDFDQIVEAGRLQELKGVGEAIAKKVETLCKEGSLPYHRELKASVPPGLLEMLEIPSLGGKKVHRLYEELGLQTIPELEAACREGKVASLKGFGQKTAEKILSGIANRQAYGARHLRARVEEVTEAILQGLRGLAGVRSADAAGSYRRRRETVGDLDFLVASSEPESVMDWFVSVEGVTEVTAHGTTKSSIRLEGGLQADLRVVPEEQYVFALHHFTGSKDHNVQMRQRALRHGYSLSEWGIEVKEKGKPEASGIHDEAALFRFLGLSYVPPELREGRGEVEAAEEGSLPKLICSADLKGAFHNHTRASDGKASLEEMAEVAAVLGWEYIGIADHSKASFQANGLDEARVEEQMKQIDALNASGRFSVHIFKGIECDILKDGLLDLEDEVLAKLDYVVASVHSSFSLSEEEMTKRLIRAMEHPSTTMLGHLTGRLLLRREGYAVDTRRIVDAAVANRVMIELNANPHRLDMDWRHWKRARDAGVLCVINPDAHWTDGLKDVRYGVEIARKGWLGPEDVVNTKGLEAMQKLLAEWKTG